MPDVSLLHLGWDPAEPPPEADLWGRIVRADRGLVTVETAGGPVRAELGRLGAAAGDWVVIAPGDPPRLADVLPRRSALTRHAAGTATVEQVVAANIDTVFVVVSLGHDVNLRRLERALALTWSSGAVPVVVLTKADRCRNVSDPLAAVESVAVGVDVVVTSSVTGEGLDQLHRWTAPSEGERVLTVVLLGASGAGKSSLVNALAGEEVMATGGVRLTDAKGRHTTTHRQLVGLPGGGLLLDTPGMRTIGLWDASDGAGSDEVLQTTFPDIEELAAGCRFGDCAHDGEPGCAVAEAVAGDRLASWHKLQRELASVAARHDKRLAAQQRKDRMPFIKEVRRMTKEIPSRRDR